MSGTAMLNVNDLFVSYGQSQAIHGISFGANRNETVAVMGRNGMGKTTLFKALMGVLPLKGGKVVLFGASPMVQEVLNDSALDQIMPIVSTQDEAVALLAD